MCSKYSDIKICVPNPYRLTDQPPPDIEVYRLSFSFDEIASIITWRCQISALLFPDIYNSPWSDNDATSSRLDQAASEIASTPQRYRTIIEEFYAWEASFLRTDFELADQNFLSAMLAAESLRKIQHGERTELVALVHMIASVDEIHFYVSKETLTAVPNSELGRSSKLLAFVLWEMIYRQTRSQDNDSSAV